MFQLSVAAYYHNYSTNFNSGDLSQHLLRIAVFPLSFFPPFSLVERKLCSLGRGRIRNEKIPYFFGYKTEFFPFQNKPKNLDPSFKMDLDYWDCLGRLKLVL